MSLASGAFHSSRHGSLVVHSWPRALAARSHPSAMVFLHGWGDHGARYGELASLLAAAGVDCFAPDFFGHGGSPGPRAVVHDFEDLVQDLDEFLDTAIAERPVYLCGHSMGGALAAHYAIRFPARTAGVVFNSAALAINRTIPAWKRRMSRMLGKVLPSLPLGALKQPSDMARSIEAQRVYAQDRRIHHGAIDAGTGRCLLLANEWIEANAADLRVPFLALQGEEDRLVAPDGPRRLAATCRAPATVRMFPGARHDLLLDVGADVLAAEILGWLAAHKSVAAA